MKRAVRRHHLARMKKKARRIYWWNENGYKFANHLKVCSCIGCGNPRKWFGDKTIQERKHEYVSDFD